MKFGRTSLVGTSKTLIKEIGRHTKKGFQRAIKGKSQVGTTKAFDILRASNLSLDNESRLDKRQWELREHVVDCSSIAVKGCEVVSLIDCVFLAAGKITGIGDALYFSGVTFATIGYGDIVPAGHARCVAVIEGLSGVLLASCFVVSLVRRHVD